MTRNAYIQDYMMSTCLELCSESGGIGDLSV